jgi:high-affinity iron transporter
MIAFLAAGMAAQSAFFLEQAGTVDIMSQTVWDTSDFLSEKSILGRVLHTLVGYSDQPSLFQVVVYLVTLLIIYALTRSFASTAKPQAVGH